MVMPMLPTRTSSSAVSTPREEEKKYCQRLTGHIPEELIFILQMAEATGSVSFSSCLTFIAGCKQLVLFPFCNLKFFFTVYSSHA